MLRCPEAISLRGSCVTLWLATALLLCACTREIETTESLPKPIGPPPMIAQTSRIEIQAELPLSSLQDALERAVPNAHAIDEEIKLKVPLLGSVKIPFRGSLQRRALHLSPAPPRIAFTADLFGSGSAPVRWDVGGTVTGTLKPEIDAQYRLHANAQSDIRVHEAALHVEGLRDVSVRSLLEERYRQSQGDWATKLDESLNRKSRLKTEAARLWASGFGAVPVGHGDPLTLLYQPTRLYLSQPRASADGRLRVALALEGQTQLVVGASLQAPAATPLPAPRFVDHIGQDFSLTLPVVADIGVVADVLSQRMSDGRLKLENQSVKIKRVGAGIRDQRLVLRIEAEAGPRWRRTQATLFVQGVPYIDAATRELRLRDLAYTLQSRDALLHAASYLLSSRLLAEIQARARYPLQDIERRAQAGAERLAEQLAQRSKGMARLQVTRVGLDALRMQEGYLVVFLSAQGRTQTQLQALLQ